MTKTVPFMFIFEGIEYHYELVIEESSGIVLNSTLVSTRAVSWERVKEKVM